MSRHNFPSAVSSVLRVVPAFVLAMALIPWSFGPPDPVRADDTDAPFQVPIDLVDLQQVPVEPAARVQVIIKSVDVSNDRDGFWTGAGDILLTTSIWRCTGKQPPCSASETNPAELLAEDEKSFSADSGDAVALNRLFPTADDVESSPAASEDGGIAVYDGVDYLLQFNAFERDFSGGDFMGGVQRLINASNNWGAGTYTREAAGPLADTSPPSRGLLCAGCGDIIVGDYLVTYEIRLVPLPDLHPKAIRVQSPGGPQPQVCATIENLGTVAAEAYGMIFTLDGDPTSRISGRLNPNQSQEQCVQVDPIALGNHTLSVSVDPDRAIPESNEGNNILTQTYVRRLIDDVVAPLTGGVLDTGTASDTGQPPITRENSTQGGMQEPITQGGTQGTPTQPIQTAPGPRANLQVSAIRVKGRNPSGQNDCDPGRNDIGVVIKNQGGSAANVSVRVAVDGKNNEAQEKSVASLDAGQELTVTFDDVQLKGGEHRLTATVDGKSTITESKEDDNELSVTVSCKDENG